MPKIVLIYVESGGGHRAAAHALCRAIRAQQLPWQVETASIQDLLDSIDFIRKLTSVRFQDVYNILLRRGWTAGFAQLIPLAHLAIRLTHRRQVKVLERYWRASRPNLVVSLIPHYNRALKESLEHACPGTPFVTLLTDIADYPPHFWIENQDQYVICGSERAAAQAGEIGIPPDHILRTSGMILDPRFYEPIRIDRSAERIRSGLDPDLPTGLVLFGGEGSAEMLRVVKALNRTGSRLQLILLCGRNAHVADRLRGLEKRIPMLVEGFTRAVPFYMELSDFFIGKPGPGSISEAVAKRLPVIVQRNAWTMAHEAYNTVWLEEQGYGLVVRDFARDIASAVDTLLEPATYARFRAATSRAANYAVFEIPQMLERILSFPSHGRQGAVLAPAGINLAPQR